MVADTDCVGLAIVVLLAKQHTVTVVVIERWIGQRHRMPGNL